MSDGNLDGLLFKAHVDKMLLAMRVLADVPVGEIVETINYTDAIAPFIDPTAYMKALDRGDMHTIGRLAEALKPALKVWHDEIAPKLDASLDGGQS